MEEILQYLVDGNFYFTLFFVLIFIPILYYLRPRYFPCKYWKIVVLFHIMLGLFTVHICEADNILYKEKISTLIKTEGILKYKEPRSRSRGGYYLEYLEGKKIMWLSFVLCDSPKNYLLEKTTVWHDDRKVVYHMQVDEKIIFDIEESNKKVWLGNLFYFETWLTVFIIMLISIFAMLHELNNHHKGEDFK